MKIVKKIVYIVLFAGRSLSLSLADGGTVLIKATCSPTVRETIVAPLTAPGLHYCRKKGLISTTDSRGITIKSGEGSHCLDLANSWEPAKQIRQKNTA